MATDDERGIKAAEVLRLTQGQRDAAANAYVDAMGELAVWRARWNDRTALEVRIAELDA